MRRLVGWNEIGYGLKSAKEFRTLIANEEGLDALLEIKGHLEDYLPEEGAHDYLWQ